MRQKLRSAGRCSGWNFPAGSLLQLNILPITVPPLRERVEDIPLLEYFIARYVASPRTLAQLQGYIRESQNIMKRAIILAETEALVVDKISLRRESTESPQPQARLSMLAAREVEMLGIDTYGRKRRNRFGRFLCEIGCGIILQPRSFPIVRHFAEHGTASGGRVAFLSLISKWRNDCIVLL